MLLQGGCFRRYDCVEIDVDIDVAQQQDFREIRLQLLDKVVSSLLLGK